MKRWQLFLFLAAAVLLVGAERRLEGSRRFQNVRHAFTETCGDLDVVDRVFLSLLA